MLQKNRIMLSVLALLHIFTLRPSQYDAARYLGNDPYKVISSTMLNQLDMPYQGLSTAQKSIVDWWGAHFTRPASANMFETLKNASVGLTTLGDVKDAWKDLVPSQLDVLYVNSSGIRDIAYGGNVIALSAQSEGVLIYNRDGLLIKKVVANASFVTIHPTKPWLVYGDGFPTNTIKAINLVDYSVTTLNNVSVSGPLTFVRFSPDGNTLVATDADEVKVVDVTDTLEDWAISTIFTTLPTLSGANNRIAWKPDSSGFAILTGATEAHFVTPYNATVIGGGSLFASAIGGLAFNHDGTVLAATTNTNDVIIVDATAYDTTTWSTLDTVTVPLVGSSQIVAHPTKNTFATLDGTSVKTVTETLGTWALDTNSITSGSGVTGITFNTDGTALYASGQTGSYIKVDTKDINPDNWIKVYELTAVVGSAPPRLIAMSVNNVLAVKNGTEVYIFDVSESKQSLMGLVTGFTTSVDAMAWSPDGNYLFVADATASGTIYAFAATTFTGPSVTGTAAALAIGTSPTVGSIITSLAVSTSQSGTYYVAAGITLGAAALSIQIYYDTFNGTVWGGSNLANATNRFGKHTPNAGTPNTNIYVAARGTRLITAAFGAEDKGTPDANADPHVLVWNMVAPTNPSPATDPSPQLITASKMNMNTIHSITTEITALDLTSNTDAVVTVSNVKKDVHLTNDVLTTPAAMDSVTGLTNNVEAVKFSGAATATTGSLAYVGGANTDAVYIFDMSDATPLTSGAIATYFTILGVLYSVDWFAGSTTDITVGGVNGAEIIRDTDAVAQAQALVAATFTGLTDSDTYVSAHLTHPELLAQYQSSHLDLAFAKLQADAAQIFAHLKRVTKEDFAVQDMCDQAADKGRDCLPMGLTKIAQDHGLEAAAYAASLAYPDKDETRGVARYLAGAAFDFSKNNTSDVTTLRQEGGNVHTRALRKLAQPHTEDFINRAMAQQAANYIKLGQRLLDWGGMQPARKAGLGHAVTNDAVWSADGKYYVLATDGATANTGLLIYDRDHRLVKRFTPDDINSGDTTVNTVDAHPVKPWLAVGTNTTVRAINLDTFEVVDALTAGAQPGGVTKSVRFSKVADTTSGNEGDYYLAMAGTTTKVARIPSDTDILVATSWPNDTPNWNGGSAITVLITGHFAWNHDGANLKFANITTTTNINVVSKTNEIAVGATFVADLQGVSFNYNDTKLAVLHDSTDTGGTTNLPAVLAIVNSSAVSPASWTIAKTFDYGTASPGVLSTAAKFNRVEFHPSKDLLATTAKTGTNATGLVAFGELHIHDLRAASSASWKLVQTGIFAQDVMLENTDTRTTGNVNGLAWSKNGSQLLVANDSAGGKDHKAETIVYDASLSHFDWVRHEATADYSEGCRLATGLFDALHTDPDDSTNITNAKAVLVGLTSTPADDAALNTKLNTISSVDLTTTVPTELTKNIRKDLENATITNVTTAIVTDPIESSALAAALVGLRYAGIGNAITAQDTTTMTQDLISSNTTSLLPEGDLKSLRGNNLTLGSYRTIGAKLDSLVAAIRASNGLLNGPDFGSISQVQKDAVERAYVLRALMTNDAAATLNTFFTTNATEIKAVVAEVLTATFTTYTPTGVTAADFKTNTTIDLRKEIAAIAVLYIDDATVGATAAIQDIIAGAYHAAITVKDLGVAADKAGRIRRQMATLGGIGVAALLAETVPAGQTAQVGTQLARALLLNEHIRNVVVEDMGTAGHEGLSLDLSDKLLSAVAACIVLEARGTKVDLTAASPAHPTSATDLAANLGSYAAPLAYNQIFEDDLYTAIVRAAEHSKEAAEHVVELSDINSEISAANRAYVAEIAARTRGTISQRREAVKTVYAGNPNITPVPAPLVITSPILAIHTVEAVVNAVRDLMKNPTTTALNVERTALFSGETEPRTGYYAHPIRMAEELAKACGEQATVVKATKLYNALAADETQCDVDAAVKSL